MTVVKIGTRRSRAAGAVRRDMPEKHRRRRCRPPRTPAPAPVPAPVPAPSAAAGAATATVDSVEVTEQHAERSGDAPPGRRERKDDRRRAGEDRAASVHRQPPRPFARRRSRARATPRTGRYVVQVGAFSQEANAKALQKKLKSIGQESTIDHTSLYLVRIGPFETRDQAASVRAKLEAAGISAIITTQ